MKGSLSIFKRRGPREIVIIDDIYPHPLCAFKYLEYNFYLRKYSNARVLSTGVSFSFINEKRSIAEIISEFDIAEHDLCGRVQPFDGQKLPNADAFYTIFLSNAFRYIEQIEQMGAILGFTLYPGGAFNLENEGSDVMLRRVLGSPALKYVIVTQKIVYDYVLRKTDCAREKVIFIYGGVIAPDERPAKSNPSDKFGLKKNNLDIVFTANRYSPKGDEKGYDTFIDAARLILQGSPETKFHVVGNYDSDIIDISDIHTSFTFYGFKDRAFLKQLYLRMDIFISPNKLSSTMKGGFDGFPTGSAVDAVLCGVGLICSDPLRLNVALSDGKDLIIIPADKNAVHQAVSEFLINPKKLLKLSRRGQKTFTRVFDLKTQMKYRLKSFQKLSIK